MGLNLHRIVSGAIGSVNPFLPVAVQVSAGDVSNPDATRTPTYAAPVVIMAQVQPIAWRDLQQLDGLNLQGTKKVLYTNGNVDGIVRVRLKGGDLVTMPDCSVWLVVMQLEAWNITAGWTKCAICLQNGS